MPAVRLTLPNGGVVTSDTPDLAQALSRALGRDVAFAQASSDGRSSTGASAEECWPDIEGLEHRDTVTEWELPPGTFFDLATVHVLTTATLDRLRELYPQGRFEVPPFRPNGRRRRRTKPMSASMQRWFRADRFDAGIGRS